MANTKKIFARLGIACLFFFPMGIGAYPFVTARLLGQLGNQLFIMAATISLALDQQASYTFPDLLCNKASSSSQFSLNYEKIFYRLNVFQPQEPLRFVYREKKFSYDPIPYHPNMCLVGWFQSEKYFIGHKREILTLFSPSPDILDYLQQTYKTITEHPQTVSVHLRSYLKEPPEIRAMYRQIGIEYVKQAMALFPDNSLFIIFSNDMDHYKNELASISRPIYLIENEPYYHDFYLMSLCKHHIICNSSFSWWAAYLNQYPEKIVVAPANWFAPSSPQDVSDLIPPEWILISNENEA